MTSANVSLTIYKEGSRKTLEFRSTADGTPISPARLVCGDEMRSRFAMAGARSRLPLTVAAQR